MVSMPKYTDLELRMLFFFQRRGYTINSMAQRWFQRSLSLKILERF